MAFLLAVAGAAPAADSLTVLGTYAGLTSDLPRNYLAVGQNSNGGDTVVGIMASPNNTYVWQGTNSFDTSATYTNVIKPQGYAGNTFNAISANGTLAGGRADAPAISPSWTRSPAPPAAGRF